MRGTRARVCLFFEPSLDARAEAAEIMADRGLRVQSSVGLWAWALIEFGVIGGLQQAQQPRNHKKKLRLEYPAP